MTNNYTEEAEAVLTREEEVELFKRYEANDPDAREKIVKANLRFVAKVAHEFSNCGIPLSDLINEGVLGLLEVIPKYDWRRGNRFSTYAVYWVRQAIQKSVRRQCGMIRLPIRKSRALGRMNEQIRLFYLESGREPTVHELADLMHMPIETIDRLMQFREGVVSLDTTEQSDGMYLIDAVSDPDEMSPMEIVKKKQMRATVARVFQYLGEREKRVLQLRYGFNNSRQISLRHASKIMGLSQEGVRRIEERALNKLRRPAIIQKVAELV